MFSGGNLSTVSTTYFDPGMHCLSNYHIRLAVLAAVISLVSSLSVRRTAGLGLEAISQVFCSTAKRLEHQQRSY